MTWAGREFTLAVDACPSRKLMAKDLEHLQVVGDRSPEMSDLVLVYDPVTGLFTAVFQMESMFPGFAATKAVDAILTLFDSIGISASKVLIQNVHVDSVKEDDEISMSREEPTQHQLV